MPDGTTTAELTPITAPLAVETAPVTLAVEKPTPIVQLRETLLEARGKLTNVETNPRLREGARILLEDAISGGLDLRNPKKDERMLNLAETIGRISGGVKEPPIVPGSQEATVLEEAMKKLVSDAIGQVRDPETRIGSYDLLNDFLLSVLGIDPNQVTEITHPTTRKPNLTAQETMDLILTGLRAERSDVDLEQDPYYQAWNKVKKLERRPIETTPTSGISESVKNNF